MLLDCSLTVDLCQRLVSLWSLDGWAPVAWNRCTAGFHPVIAAQPSSPIQRYLPGHFSPTALTVFVRLLHFSLFTCGAVKSIVDVLLSSSSCLFGPFWQGINLYKAPACPFSSSNTLTLSTSNLFSGVNQRFEYLAAREIAECRATVDLVCQAAVWPTETRRHGGMRVASTTSESVVLPKLTSLESALKSLAPPRGERPVRCMKKTVATTTRKIGSVPVGLGSSEDITKRTIFMIRAPRKAR